MFQKASKSSGTEGASINLIGKGTNITGDITSNGDVRIDGTVKGNMTISGKLVIGPSGVLEGTVQCQNADISGDMKGKIQVTELLSIKATGKFSGDIVTDRIHVEDGAAFEGTTNKTQLLKNIPNGVQPRQETAETV